MIALIVSFVVPLLFLIGIALTNSILFKKKFEYVLPVSFMECVILIYLTGFVNLRIGFYLCILLSVASVPLLLAFRDRKNMYSIKESFFTDLFVAFLLLYTIIFVLNIGKMFSRWDEFSHWGVMAKELFRLDKYYYLDKSPLMHHKDYPPFTSILQYLWCRLCGEYKERHLYNAQMIFSLSLILPLLSPLTSIKKNIESTWKRVISILLLPFFIIILSICHTMGEASFYQTIYTENIMACLILYALFILVFGKKDTRFSRLRNTLVLTSLLLTKQIAIYFFVILFLIYIAKEILENGLCFFKRKEPLTNILCMSVFPIILWFLWQNAVAIHAPVGQFDSSKFSLENIISFFSGHGEEFQYIVTQKYFTALFKTPIICKPFPIAYVPLILFLFALILGIAKLEKDSAIRKRIYLLAFGEFISSILYIGVMFISYLYGFSQDEALCLACYDRYMCSALYPCILSVIILLLYVLYGNYHINTNILFSAIPLGCILLLIPISTLKSELRPGIFCENVAAIYEGDCRNIINTTPEGSKILVIRQRDTSSSINIIAYKTLPRVYTDTFFSFGEPYSDNDIYTLNYTVDEFTDLLKNYDYLYTSRIDKRFIEQYQIVFGDIELTNNLTFKIVQIEDGQIYLEKH